MDGIDTAFVEQRLAATAPRRWNLLGPGILSTVLLAGLVLYVLAGERLSPAPPWLNAAFGALLVLSFGLSYLLGKRRQRRRQSVVQLWEHLQLDEWLQAWTVAEELSKRPIASPSDRGQLFLALATIAEQQKRYDAAIQIYEQMVMQRIGEPEQWLQAQIALAEAKLRNEELTDALSLIGHLEQLDLPPRYRAALDLVRLHQQVAMGHSNDAVEEIEPRRDAFRRHLSTRAGEGYALLAVALHNTGRADEAARYWADATTLIPAARLATDYPVVAFMVRAYPSTERVL